PLPRNKAGNDLEHFLTVRRTKGAYGVRHKLWVGEVAVEDRPCLKRVPDVQNTSAFRSHQGRMHALMNRRVDLSRLVHDDENAPRLRVNTLDRTRVIRREPKHKPTRTEPNFRLQELGP